MKIFPQVTIDRFAQLKQGDLFIYVQGDQRCVALKCFDPTDGGDEVILLLGPKLSEDLAPAPRLIGEASMTVINFGQSYMLRLPTEPEGWVVDVPPITVPSILAADDKVYYRASIGHRPGQSKLGWVEISSGLVSRATPPGTKAYAVKWELVIQEPGAQDRVILRID